MLALRAASSAIAYTFVFFRPFKLRRYAFTALVTVFVGLRAGYGSLTNIGAVALFDTDAEAVGPAVEVVAEVVASTGAFAVGVVAVAAAALLSAVAEFVLIDVIRTDEPRLRVYARDRFGDGTRLFVFRSIATALFFVPAAGTALLVGRIPDSAVVAAFGVIAAFGIIISLLNGFTTDFVAPVMAVRDCTVLRGWKEVGSLIVDEKRAFGGYAVARVLVNVFVAVVAAVAVIVVAGLYAVPIAGASYALGLTADGLGAVLSTTAGVVLFATVAVVYVSLVVASVAVAVQLPVRLFVRSWPMYFLGELDDEYSLVDEPDDAVEPLSTYLPMSYGNQDQ
jgi:hypothetical protein